MAQIIAIILFRACKYIYSHHCNTLFSSLKKWSAVYLLLIFYNEDSMMPDSVHQSRVWVCHPWISTKVLQGPSHRNSMSSYPIINTKLLMEIQVLSYYSYKYFIHTVVMGNSVYSGFKRFCHTSVKLVSFFLSAIYFLMHGWRVAK